jgi:phage terminase large subunit
MKRQHPTQVLDPFKLAKLCWPHITFYVKQREIIRSIEENDETFVSAGNMLGKDFVAGFISLWFFLSRHPCRVVTTSADGPQLEAVLWGEIRRFIQTSAVPLEHDKGGPIVVNHLHLRKVDPRSGNMCGISYVIGRVAAKGEGMLGHHVAETGDGIPRTLFVADEASGVDDQSYKASETWARRKLVIGNPYPCQTFFKRGVKGGDLYASG